MRITHSWSDTTATIRVEGLRRTVRVLHVTDSHICLIDQRNAEYLEKNTQYRDKFAKYRMDAAGNPTHTEATFPETLLHPDHGAVDLLALTGDIVHFPAAASLEAATAAIGKLGAPFFYTSGNHDWCFTGVQCTDENRALYWESLRPLTRGEPAFALRDIHGVRFIAVDNSNYQIDADQLERTRAALDAGLPSVVMIHIPISLPSLRPEAIKRGSAPILINDPDWDLPSRNKWGTRADDQTTGEFVRLLTQSRNLAAVLCGHIHFPHADSLSSRAMQYVGKPGYEGGFRMIEIAAI